MTAHELHMNIRAGGERKSPRQLLRTIAMYSAMAAGVTVGGVVVGAVVIAPAISRGKAMFAASAAQNGSQGTESTGGAVGQADGDPLAAQQATIAEVEPFKPMAEVIASSKASQTMELPTRRRTGFAALRYEVADRFDDLLLAAGRVPKIFWVYADLSAVATLAGLWFWRRRRQGSLSAAGGSLSSKLNFIGGSASSSPIARGARTPKAVAALAEAGKSPADIARRTGLPLDAVAMLISMGSFGARQLQPPTA